MRAQKKLLASILVLPFAYADLSVSGSVDYISTIGTIDAETNLFDETNGFTTNNDITIPITNNGDTGWTLSMRSANGGSFFSESGGSGVGHQIGYTIGNCTLSNSNHRGIETLITEATNISDSYMTIASVSSPMQSTSADLTCYFALASGASVSNLLSDGTNEAEYTFSDTIYVDLSPYTAS